MRRNLFEASAINAIHLEHLYYPWSYFRVNDHPAWMLSIYLDGLSGSVEAELKLVPEDWAGNDAALTKGVLHTTIHFPFELTITDAFVDAHLARFDVSEDLSLRLTPHTQTTPGLGFSMGVGLNLEFGGSRNNKVKRPVQPIVNP